MTLSMSGKVRILACLICLLALLAAATPSAPGLTRITTKSGHLMVLLPAGQFSMGSNTGGADEKPVHTVKVSAFYIDAYLVTQKSYEALMKANPLVGCGSLLQRALQGRRAGARLQPHDLAGEQRARRLPAAHGGRVGVRLPRGDEDEVLLRR
jgi:formylglycine-generating enzyme required for sulfatase activity